ncbi:hypothetical protein AKJ35_00805 [candidate division MSBL1 archaeon SCGC-AAA833F18]|uniref:Carbohydrate-binding module family 96 domain-containing protein n=1 Tax=candidate division MSBL1 archaeon SCGC-AAA833F18 TaxID=1698257 RepID=A0A133VSN4_9EURY|nr:hypothetical protein AKJ35_00805 [candidate division MSBL1 archaeon SCGC-AAA833F18]
MILLALTSPPTAARPDSTAQVNPSDDAFVAEDMPDTNTGVSINAWVGSTEYGYLKFNLPAVAENALVTSATLNLYHEGGYGSGLGTYDVHRVNESWSEDTITWNNQPEYETTETSSLSFDPTDNGKWRSWDVTSDIASAALSDEWVSWLIKGRKGGSWEFFTKENPTNPPYLEITYNVAPTLSSGKVTPTTDEWGTSFAFEVTYTDADNDLPITYPRLFIDGENTGRTTTEKDPADQDVTDGKVYKHTVEALSEDVGIHNFYFYVEDPTHGFSARYPLTGGQDGPTVIKRSVTLTCSVDNDAPDPGQAITFSGHLKDSKGVALTQKTVRLFINGSDTGLTAITDNDGFYSISTKAPENRGSFTYDVRFTEEDLYSSTQSSAVSISTEAPEAISELPLVWVAAVVIVVAAIGALLFVKKGR